jgi:hypothetical protein
VGPLPFVRAGEMIRPGLELPPCWYQNLAESASISAGAGPGYEWSRVRAMGWSDHHTTKQRPGVELSEGVERKQVDTAGDYRSIRYLRLKGGGASGGR